MSSYFIKKNLTILGKYGNNITSYFYHIYLSYYFSVSEF